MRYNQRYRGAALYPFGLSDGDVCQRLPGEALGES